MNKTYTIILTTLVIGICMGRFFRPTELIQSAQASNTLKTEETFSKDSVLEYMKELNIKYIEFSYAQVEHETGDFTSNVFKDNHNMFGMKVAEFRPTTAKGWNRKHARYKNWKDSVIDFALLQTRILAKTKNKQEYMAHIQKFYAKDRKYLKKVNKIVERNRKIGIFKK